MSAIDKTVDLLSSEEIGRTQGRQNGIGFDGEKKHLQVVFLKEKGSTCFFVKDTNLIMVAEKKAANKRGSLKVESLKLQLATNNIGLFPQSGRLSLRQTTSLVSLRLPDGKLRAADYLQNQAMKFNSRVLFSMATRLSGADPMANVRKMLNSLITTLETESSEAVRFGGGKRMKFLELHKSRFWCKFRIRIMSFAFF